MPPNKRICWPRHNICDTLHTLGAYTILRPVGSLLLIPERAHSSITGRGTCLVAYPEVLHCLTALGCDHSRATTPLGKSAGSLQPSEPHPARRKHLVA